MLRYIRTFSFILLILISFWFIGFVYFVHTMSLVVPDNHTMTDAIVVLTGGKGRIDQGIALLAANKAQKLLITGVGSQAKLEEIHIYDYEQAKLLSDKITLGYVATNTKGNVQETIHWMKDNNFKTIRLVTSEYHMPRACLEFAMAISKEDIIFNPVVSDNIKLNTIWKSPIHLKLIGLEYSKFIWLYIYYNIKSSTYKLFNLQ
ncbi:hypothetical protein NOVO_04410 [Rickettsiales bacterium Ac37b]|nr:hypothetical protein NOVO_04410 [Rickettsiales bacterium Ac37b]